MCYLNLSNNEHQLSANLILMTRFVINTLRYYQSSEKKLIAQDVSKCLPHRIIHTTIINKP